MADGHLPQQRPAERLHVDHVDQQPTRSWVFPWLVLSSGLLAVTFTITYGLNIRSYQDNQRFAKLMNRPLAGNDGGLMTVLATPVESMRYARTEKLAVFDNILRSAEESLSAAARERVFQKAIELVDEASQAQPRDYRIRYNGALLLVQAGYADTGIERLEELAQDLPRRTVIWHTLSSLYSADGRHGASAYARQTANQLNPDWSP